MVASSAGGIEERGHATAPTTPSETAPTASSKRPFPSSDVAPVGAAMRASMLARRRAFEAGSLGAVCTSRAAATKRCALSDSSSMAALLREKLCEVFARGAELGVDTIEIEAEGLPDFGCGHALEF